MLGTPVMPITVYSRLPVVQEGCRVVYFGEWDANGDYIDMYCNDQLCYDLHKWEWKWDMAEPHWGTTGSVVCMSAGAGEGSELNDCIGSLVSTSFVKWVQVQPEAQDESNHILTSRRQLLDGG